MGHTMYDEFASTPDGRRLLNRATLAIEITELICRAMQEKRISRKKFAEMLGKSKGRVSQMLDGERNLTLKTVADMFTVLEQRLEVRGRPDPLCQPDAIPFRIPRMKNWVEQSQDEQVWKYEGTKVHSVGCGRVAS